VAAAYPHGHADQGRCQHEGARDIERPGQPEVGGEVPGHRRTEDHDESQAGTSITQASHPLLAARAELADLPTASSVLVMA
jgi:hypothetical protein